MSEPTNSAFYGDGDDGRQLAAAIANLYELTGSWDCAEELVLACNEVEEKCGPNVALIPMPAWRC